MAGVVIPRGLVARPVDSDSFADLLPDAAVEVRHVGGNLLLEFSREPTEAERAAVVGRVVTDTDGDDLRACADDILARCQEFLDATSTPDATEQVRLLTEALTMILRLLLRRP